MRKKLKQLGSEERHTFTAEFGRFGTKTGWRYPVRTVLLKNIKLKDSDGVLTDHLWFTCGKQFDEICLEEGDRVQFDARVDSYTKGYFGHDELKALECPVEKDFRLSRPTNVFKLDLAGNASPKPERFQKQNETRMATDRMIDFAKAINSSDAEGIGHLEVNANGDFVNSSFDSIRKYISENAKLFKDWTKRHEKKRKTGDMRR